MQKRCLGPCVTFFPQPTTLVTSVDGQGVVDLMTASWTGIVSKTPPTLGLSLQRGRKTYENIHETGCFVVNLVPAALAIPADFCGLTSGRQQDKVAGSGLTLTPATQVAAPVVQESPLNLECRVCGEVDLGEYRLVLGEILEIHAIEQAFAADGSIDARQFDPLVYLGGIREYWNLGAKIAPAYQAGKPLLR